MKEALAAILGSKKALATIAGLITTALMRFGFDVPREDVMAFVGLIGAYVVGQGVADHGKERAKAETVRAAVLGQASPTPDP